MTSRRYSADLSADLSARRAPAPELPAERDLVVEEVVTGFCGAVLRWEKGPGGETVTLQDRRGRNRTFPLGPGFHLDGKAVVLVRPGRGPSGAAPTAPARTASGSLAVHGRRARVARESRIYVEGSHDAELVEKVWGADLRVEGVVVEHLGGIDDLPAVVAGFRPGPGRRLGVLVDHLVAGSKESRLAARVVSPQVLILGHPYVDIWQAVRPGAVGIRAWPAVPHAEVWKEGVLRRLGWPAETPADVAAGWRRILAGVSSYADLEPALLGRVEELIDFVTAPGSP
jgi:hypothetical protein